MANTSLTAPPVVRELNRIVEIRGCPRMIVSDNGTDFTKNAILAWQRGRDVEWLYVAPAEPMQNGCIEFQRSEDKFGSSSVNTWYGGPLSGRSCLAFRVPSPRYEAN